MTAMPRLPELGGFISALVAPPSPVPPLAPDLAPVRLALATTVIEQGAVARAAVAEGREQEARDALSRETWEQAWQEARDTAASELAETIGQRLHQAGLEARLSARRLRTLPLDDADRAAIAVRLGADAAPFFAALDQLEAVRPGDMTLWVREVERTARRLDEAWRRLEAAARAELAAWEPEVAAVRAARPPAWPLWLAAGVILALGLAVGLMLGGYVDVPAPLRPLAERVWGVR